MPPSVSADRPAGLKRYTIAAGSPITIRTLGRSNPDWPAKEFVSTLENPIVINGHTLAAEGTKVLGTLTGVEPGGSQGKASLRLVLKSILLADGRTVAIRTETVTQQAKGATARGTASDIPADAVLTFRIAEGVEVTEKL